MYCDELSTFYYLGSADPTKGDIFAGTKIDKVYVTDNYKDKSFNNYQVVVDPKESGKSYSKEIVLYLFIGLVVCGCLAIIFLTMFLVFLFKYLKRHKEGSDTQNTDKMATALLADDNY